MLKMGRVLLPFFLLCLFFAGVVLAERQHQQPQFRENECQFNRLNTLEPSSRIESEAGLTEVWDPNENEFKCAGVALMRRTIEPNGLLLPFYRTTPELVYVIQGKGIHGMMVPGCPETFQSVPQREEGVRGERSSRSSSSRFRDQHQKIRRFREGDILALPAGIPHWVFNDGDEPLVVVVLLDSTNRVNQLDQTTPRTFFLAGNPQQEFQQFIEGGSGSEGRGNNNNVLAGFDSELLQQVFGLPEETIRNIQQGGERGHIVRAERMRVIRPPTLREEEEWEERRYGGQSRRPSHGGSRWEEEEEWRPRGHGGSGRSPRVPREWRPFHRRGGEEEDWPQSERRGEEVRGSRRGYESRGGEYGEEVRGSRRGYPSRGGEESVHERRQHGGGGRWEEQTEEERRQHPHHRQQHRGSKQWEEQGERDYPQHHRGSGSRWEEEESHRGYPQHHRGSGSRWEEEESQRGQRGYPQQHHGGSRWSESESEERWKHAQREQRGHEGWPGRRGTEPRWETGRQHHQQCRCEENNNNNDCCTESNAIGETVCSVNLRQNIDDPSRADVFVPQAGRLTTLNSFNLPILSYLRLNAEKGVLYSNAIVTPKYTLNAHTIIYVTRGNARIQVVNARGENVFDDEVNENQVVVIPQGFVVVKQAGENGFEWVGFKTNDMAKSQALVGRTSALRALPVEVVMNAYRVERDEAEKLKYGREETVLLAPTTGRKRRSGRRGIRGERSVRIDEKVERRSVE